MYITIILIFLTSWECLKLSVTDENLSKKIQNRTFLSAHRNTWWDRNPATCCSPHSASSRRLSAAKVHAVNGERRVLGRHWCTKAVAFIRRSTFALFSTSRRSTDRRATNGLRVTSRQTCSTEIDDCAVRKSWRPVVCCWVIECVGGRRVADDSRLSRSIDVYWPAASIVAARCCSLRHLGNWHLSRRRPPRC
jgi:hypothetical protein